MSGALTARQALAAAQASLAERPLLVVSDFDGTLSHIVLDPWGASILPTARRALRQLAGMSGVTVALLSGRTAADVAARARVGGALYLGNHGLERAYLTRRGRAEALAVTRAAEHDGYEVEVERIASSLPGLVPEPWLVVERKAP
ncbi:MAG TPA: trehalose-phosphatase, partial [Candidatus Limnocylindrales bacterium]|nr:trehalose-phosphatase [Candidatus Limnocylindrales bacterium]